MLEHGGVIVQAEHEEVVRSSIPGFGLHQLRAVDLVRTVHYNRLVTLRLRHRILRTYVCFDDCSGVISRRRRSLQGFSFCLKFLSRLL